MLAARFIYSGLRALGEEPINVRCGYWLKAGRRTLQSTLQGRLTTCLIENIVTRRAENTVRGFIERREEQFRLLFEDTQRQLIRPRMEELAQFLAKRFIPTQITTNERRYDSVGRLVGAVGITIRAYVNSSPRDVISDIPHYAIYWDPANLVARFYRNSNASRMAGDLMLDGKAAVHELTSDLIERKLLGFAEAIA